MARRESGEINAGSMADIAFLLLIFFLVTTTMDKDNGIMRQLPPPTPDDYVPPPVRERDVFKVLANANDQLLVEGNLMEIENLGDAVKQFYTNPEASEDLPQLQWMRKTDVQNNLDIAKANLRQAPNDNEARKNVKKWENKLKAVELLGDYQTLPGSAIISMQNNRGTSYNLYVQVQNELSVALNELRDELSLEKFSVKFSDLDPKNEQDKPKIIAIRQVYPQRVSEAEARSTGGG